MGAENSAFRPSNSHQSSSGRIHSGMGTVWYCTQLMFTMSRYIMRPNDRTVQIVRAWDTIMGIPGPKYVLPGRGLRCVGGEVFLWLIFCHCLFVSFFFRRKGG